MSRNTEEIRNPHIRFKGFTDTWEQCELGDLADIVGGGTPSTAVSEYWNGDIEWYSPIEIGEKVYLNSSQNKITKLGLYNSSARVLPVGTVLFTSRAGIGKTAILAKEGSTNQGFQSILPKHDKLDTYFIFSRADELKKYSETVGAGSTFIEVSGKQLAKMPIKVPNIKEQRVIGTFFEKVDNLITLHQRKYDKLVNIKKSLLDKIFPRNGKVIPQLRFKGFTFTWQQYKLGDLYQFTKGKGLPLNSFYEGKDSLSIAYGHLYTKYSEVINEVSLSSNDNNGVLSQKGDILFPGSSTVPYGTAQSNAIMLNNIKLGGDVIIARARNFIPYAPFISYQINAQKQKLFPITVGTTITHMYGKDISNIEFSFPKFDEQIKVGRILEAFDSLITLHLAKLEKLKNIKKSLLNKMFD